jgi:hypothetical protein
MNKRSKYKYFGNKRNNQKQGFGKIVWEDKSYFIGMFYDNKVNGIGSFTNNDNSQFIGKPLLYRILYKQQTKWIWYLS